MDSKLESAIQNARFLAKTFGADDMSGGCFYHALSMHVITGAPIVAGSFGWRFTDLDNGTNPTHFSCVFDRTAQKLAETLIQKNAVDKMLCLPEMHVWNLAGEKVLDISTAFVPDLARKTVGFEFEKHLTPPDYLLGDPQGPGGQWLYEAHPLATQFVGKLIETMMPRRAGGAINGKS